MIFAVLLIVVFYNRDCRVHITDRVKSSSYGGAEEKWEIPKECFYFLLSRKNRIGGTDRSQVAGVVCVISN